MVTYGAQEKAPQASSVVGNEEGIMGISTSSADQGSGGASRVPPLEFGAQPRPKPNLVHFRHHGTLVAEG